MLNLDLIKLLLKSDANRNLKDRFGYRPLDIAQKLFKDAKSAELKRKIKLMIDILKPGMIAQILPQKPVTATDRRVSSLIINLSIDEKYAAEIDPCAAVTRNDHDQLDRFLRSGGQADHKSPDGHTLLDLAFQTRNTATIERIISAGADPNQV